MRLNILSDLHLSLGALPLPQNDADLVILAGDVARPEQAIAWASGFAKPVLYVAGNHEFYGGTVTGTLARLKELTAGTQVHVLDNDEIVIDGIRFLGTTLWTDFMLFGTEERRAASMREALAFMRDFTKIRCTETGDAKFIPADSAALFARHAQWLEERLAQVHAGPTVVITHHAPSPRSVHPRYADSLLNACFVSDAEHLLDSRRVHLWIHGHTHDSFDYLVKGTRVLCNPRGYVKEEVNENRAFDPDLIVDTAELMSPD